MRINPNSDIEKALQEFRELREEMRVTTQVDPILLNADKVDEWLEKSLLSIRESTLKSVLELECMQEVNPIYTNEEGERHVDLCIDRDNLLRNQIRDELGKKI